MVGAVRFMPKPPDARRIQVAGATGTATVAQEEGPRGAGAEGMVPNLLSCRMRPTQKHAPIYVWPRQKSRGRPSWLRSVICNVMHSQGIRWNA